MASSGVVGLNRAGEVDDLITAIKGLIVPYVRAADEAAEERAAGSTTAGGTNNLVQSHAPKDLIEKMRFSLPEGQGRGKEGLLEVAEDVLRYSVNTWDQGFMDKLYSSTNAVGVVSEMLLATLNTNSHVFSVSPTLTVVEKLTARRLASLFGFTGPNAGGITCQGGSAANLTSMAIARCARDPDTKQKGNSGRLYTVFTSAHGHYSVEKAAVTLGLGADAVRPVPIDHEGRMQASALREAVLASKEAGETPLYVNATAGTTVLGSFDPFEDLSAVCREFGLWLHIDASWGGSAAFSPTQRALKLKGSGLVNSITVNPHKMLNVPVTCSFLLTNDLRVFHAANTLRAGYLFHQDDDDNSNDEDKPKEFWDLADLTLQCGRRGDALKLALAWVYYGEEGFANRVDGAFGLAAKLAGMVRDSPDFELLSTDPPPCLQVCFYYTRGSTAGDEEAKKVENTGRTKAMVAKLLQRGFMIDYAPGPRGSFFRIVVNCQTLESTVDGLFRALEEVGREVVA